MNFLGMGSLEVFVILVIAFLFLGPGKMVEAARTLGKLVAQVRRMTAELPDMIDGEIDGKRPAATPSTREDDSAAVSSEVSDQTEAKHDPVPDDDGPVPFRSPDGAGDDIQADGASEQPAKAERRHDA